MKSTAKHSIIRGYLSKYEIYLNIASKIYSLDKQTIYDFNYEYDDDSDDNYYDSIVSKNLIICGNSWHTLRNWILSRSSNLRDFDIWARVKIIILFLFLYALDSLLGCFDLFLPWLLLLSLFPRLSCD